MWWGGWGGWGGWGLQSYFIVKPNLVLRLGWGFDNFDLQGVVDLFIHEISGDWSQIMSKLDFSSGC